MNENNNQIIENTLDDYEAMMNEFGINKDKNANFSTLSQEEYEKLAEYASGKRRDAKDNEKKFVTITFSRQQMLGKFTANDMEFCRILAPEGYSFIREARKVKPSLEHEQALCFSVPGDYQIKLSKSVKEKEPVLDDAGNVIEKAAYKYETKKVTARELYDMYQIQREEYRKKHNSDFITIIVDNEYVGKPFEIQDKGMFVKITAPGNISCIRHAEQVNAVPETNESSFMLKKDYIVHAVKSRCIKRAEYDAKGNITSPAEYSSEKIVYSAEEYAGLFNPMEIVFDVNKIVGEVVSKSSGMTFSRIIVQEGYSMLYPTEYLSKPGDGTCVIKSYPGYDFMLQKSSRIEGAPEDAPADKKYKTESVMISAVKLSEILEPIQMPSQRR